MIVRNAFASLASSDLGASVAWYAPLLGEPTRPLDAVRQWQLADGGGVQVYLAPERAGRGTATLIVDDVQEVAATLRDLGRGDVEPVIGDRVDTVMVKDPDGNSVAFAHPK